MEVPIPATVLRRWHVFRSRSLRERRHRHALASLRPSTRTRVPRDAPARSVASREIVVAYLYRCANLPRDAMGRTRTTGAVADALTSPDCGRAPERLRHEAGIAQDAPVRFVLRPPAGTFFQTRKRSGPRAKRGPATQCNDGPRNTRCAFVRYDGFRTLQRVLPTFPASDACRYVRKATRVFSTTPLVLQTYGRCNEAMQFIVDHTNRQNKETRKKAVEGCPRTEDKHV